MDWKPLDLSPLASLYMLYTYIYLFIYKERARSTIRSQPKKFPTYVDAYPSNCEPQTSHQEMEWHGKYEAQDRKARTPQRSYSSVTSQRTVGERCQICFVMHPSSRLHIRNKSIP